jgi:hypothetical protein
MEQLRFMVKEIAKRFKGNKLNRAKQAIFH